MLGDNRNKLPQDTCTVRVFIDRPTGQWGKAAGMTPAVGQGSSHAGAAWRALAEPHGSQPRRV